jgi:hypothetical protein
MTTVIAWALIVAFHGQVTVTPGLTEQGCIEQRAAAFMQMKWATCVKHGMTPSLYTLVFVHPRGHLGAVHRFDTAASCEAYGQALRDGVPWTCTKLSLPEPCGVS